MRKKIAAAPWGRGDQVAARGRTTGSAERQAPRGRRRQAEEAQATQQQETRKSNEPSTAEVIGKSVTKVVTSASFIRGVFGILNKIFRK